MPEPLNATFFALSHRDRAVLIPATVVLIVVVAALIGVFLAINWHGLANLFEAIQHAGPGGKVQDEQALGFVSAIFTLLGSIFLLMIPLYLVIAAYEAACLRWMIRGEAPGLFGFTLNNDVWRVWGTYWCWVAVHFAVGMAMSIITFPLMMSMMGSVMTSGKPDPDAMLHWQLTVQLPISLLQYLPLIFLGVRLGAAAATSVLRQRFSFLDAWKVTRGRFWTLLRSFALLWLICALVGVVVFGAIFGYFFHDLLPDWRGSLANWHPSEEDLRAVFARVFSPQGLIAYALCAVVNLTVLLGYAVLSYGINARAAMAALEDGKIDMPAQS